jgi:DNA repair protein RadA/Sms
MPTRTIAVCQSCGAQSPRWVGRCTTCGEWGSVVEEPVERGAPVASVAAPTATLAEHDPSDADRVPTGLPEVDLVLGGGLVRGSVVLLAGEPGIGKSTIALQVALRVGHDCGVLLVCGEEAPQQIRARAERLGPIPSGVRTLADPSLPGVLAAVASGEAAIVVVDSIQTVFDPELPSAPGSVTQVRECGARLARAARENGVTVILVGHVTKEGTVAGPRVLEHLVDVVVSFDGDRSGTVRMLRPLKNRFGPTDEVGFFEMATEGLVPIRDASAFLLADRCPGLPGSALAALVEGRRPFVSEIQALVQPSGVSVPRRNALGTDAARLSVLAAVLDRRAGVKLADHEVFVSAPGGLQASEPAADLAIALALMSAYRDVPVPEGLVAFGEVGLAGEIRRVVASDRRLAEAQTVGCTHALVPAGLEADVDGIELVRVRHVAEVLDVLEPSTAVRVLRS